MGMEILGKIESLLRKKLGKAPEVVLVDHFDFIFGPCNGAVSADILRVGASYAVKNFVLEHFKGV